MDATGAENGGAMSREKCSKISIEDTDYFVCDECIAPLVHRSRLEKLERYLREAIELLERDAPIGGATFNACKKFRAYLEGR